MVLLLLTLCVVSTQATFGQKQGDVARLKDEQASPTWKLWSGHACHGNEATCGKVEYHLCDFVLVSIDECKHLCLQDPSCDGIGIRTQEDVDGMIEPKGFCRLHKTRADPWMIRGWDCHMLINKPTTETGLKALSADKEKKLSQLKMLHEHASLVLTEEKYQQAKQKLAS